MSRSPRRPRAVTRSGTTVLGARTSLVSMSQSAVEPALERATAAGQRATRTRLRRANTHRLGRDRAAGDLLRRRVLGREHAPTPCASALFAALPSSISLAMPKSSRCTCPCASTRMFDGLRSRWTISRECAYATARAICGDERDAGAYVELVLATVDVDRLAFDVLEREIRPAVLGDARVVQAPDVRMLERREDLALLRRALGAASTAPTSAAASARPFAAGRRRCAPPATPSSCRLRRPG